MELVQNAELFSPDYREYTWKGGALVQKRPRVDPKRHCYYRGKIGNSPASNVRLSTCGGGLEGLIQAHGQDFLIFPAHRTKGLRSVLLNPTSHVFLLHSDLDEPHRECAHHNSDSIMRTYASGGLPQPSSNRDVLGRRLLAQPTKYVELLLVNDNMRFNQDTRAETDGASIANYVDSYYDGSNFDPPVRVTLTGQITFENGDPYETPPTQNGGVNVEDLLLNKFLPWASNLVLTYPNVPQHDSHVLVSGYDFEGYVVGLAVIGGMCENSHSGAITQARGFSSPTEASTIAHEMGHTLSMLHDDQITPPCPSGYIMWSAGSATSPANRFSDCSKSAYQSWVSKGKHCLDNVPDSAWQPGVCGNGVVEMSEDCDCGKNGYNPNGCCQCDTCRLASTKYQCSDQLPCCSNCLPIPSSTKKKCHEAASSCDGVEYCDGRSGFCPNNNFADPGTSCTDRYGVSGYCYNHVCHTWEGQCKNISSNYTACPNRAYDPKVPICELQYCTNGSSTCFALTTSFAEDGVPCGSQKQCLSGQCLASSDMWTGLNPRNPDDGESGSSLEIDWRKFAMYGGIFLAVISVGGLIYRCCCSPRRRSGGGGTQVHIDYTPSPEPFIGGGAPVHHPGQRSSISVQSNAQWSHHKTSDGRDYWFNKENGQTSWVQPS